jgi:hypothetical protein
MLSLMHQILTFLEAQNRLEPEVRLSSPNVRRWSQLEPGVLRNRAYRRWLEYEQLQGRDSEFLQRLPDQRPPQPQPAMQTDLLERDQGTGTELLQVLHPELLDEVHTELLLDRVHTYQFQPLLDKVHTELLQRLLKPSEQTEVLPEPPATELLHRLLKPSEQTEVLPEPPATELLHRLLKPAEQTEVLPEPPATELPTVEANNGMERRLREFQLRLMLLEGGLEVCQQDEQRLAREAQGLAQDRQLIRERHDLQQRLKLEQRIRLQHPPDAPMKVELELLRYPPAPLLSSQGRLNRVDEVWTIRMGSRLAGVAVAKRAKEYLTPWYVTKAPAPTTPDARDRCCSKRSWEDRMNAWKQQLAEHSLASNDEQLQELWQAGWDSL